MPSSTDASGKSLPGSRSRSLRRHPLGPPGAHVALVASNGTVLGVNNGWLRFARRNGDPPLSKIGVGANYFSVCRRAAADRDGFAAEALQGILNVVHRKQIEFTLDYPCHAPGRPSWYRMTVTRGPDGRSVLVAHQQIDSKGDVESKSRQ